MKLTAISIVKKLREAGFIAYFAGGSVRDLLLGKQANDYDIATNAKPEQIEKLFDKTVPIGKKFGVILVLENSHQFEVATFRSDSGYSDGRRPDAVLFTDAQEDAKRRDFTINGMFYYPLKKEVIDYVGGQKDLKEKLVHFIGDPAERIKEDNLRILRAVRLVHQIHGQYHPDTYKAIKQYAFLIEKVSVERIRDELNKILIHPNRASALQDLAELGILQHLLPELLDMRGVAQPQEYHQEGSVWQHMLRSLKTIKHVPSIEFVWTVMLHDVGKPATFSVQERVRFNQHAEVGSDMARKILQRFNFPRSYIEEIPWLIRHHMSLGNVLKMPKDKQAHWIMDPRFNKLMSLLKADGKGALPVDLRLYHDLQVLQKQVKKRLPKQLPKLISGETLISKFGMLPGPEIGQMLEKVRMAQLRGSVKTKKQALDFVDRAIKKK